MNTIMDRQEFFNDDVSLILVCGFPRNLSIFLNTVGGLIEKTGMKFKVVILAPRVPTHCPDAGLLFKSFQKFASLVRGSGLRRIDLIRAGVRPQIDLIRPRALPRGLRRRIDLIRAGVLEAESFVIFAGTSHCNITEAEVDQNLETLLP